MLIKTMLSSISLLLGFFWEATACSVSVQQIPDLGRRGSTYTVSSNELLVKDSTLWPGWYAANDGNRVYSILNGTVPKVEHCGTYYPIYVKDVPSQLTNEIEYNITACLVTDNNNCQLQYAIKIRRCDTEIHYYLKPTDGESAYCFEPPMAVEPAPNYSIPGSVLVTVALLYTDVNGVPKPQLDFKCNFEANNQYYYEISWAINDQVEITYLPVTIDGINTTNLKETDILSLGFSLGFSVKCLVRISFSRSGNRTAPQSSDVFYAGIKTSLYRVTLSVDDEKSIYIWTTFPFGCEIKPTLELCDFEIHNILFDANTNGYQCDVTSGGADNQKACSVVLNGFKRNDSGPCLGRHDISQCTYEHFKNGKERKVFKVAAEKRQDSFIQNDHKTFTLRLQAGRVSHHAILANAKLDEIKVFYDGGQGHKSSWQKTDCHAINDPNIRTFNSDSFYFDDVGDFLLYKNAKLRHDVQIKTKPCSRSDDRSVACICAVSVQAEGDVFVVDMCGKISRASFSRCRGNSLNVRMIDSQTYEIYLPSGTKIRIDIKIYTPTFLKIYVYPSPSDVDSTEGICGNLTGIFVGKYSTSPKNVSSWRLRSSAFNTPDYYNYFQPLYSPKEVCTCSQINKTNPGEKGFCFSKKYIPCEYKGEQRGISKDCNIRSKRSVRRHNHNIERLILLSSAENSDLEDVKKIKRSTESVYTEGEAYAICLEHFATKDAYRLKDDFPDNTLNGTMFACINDIMRDGHAELWTQESFLSYMSTVDIAIRRNKTYQEEKTEIVEIFTNISCPFDCNGNGECKNGSCVCRDEFEGDSCFVKRSSVLEMTDVEGGGFCDLSHGDDCHECLQFHTQNLLDGFQCKIIEDNIDMAGIIRFSEETSRAGEYENIFEGYCCPSLISQRKRRSLTSQTFIVRYNISISNDGVHFSESKPVHVYDSKCQQYLSTDGEMVFRLKDNTCFIEGKCFGNGESVADSTCCPIVNTHEWTSIQVCTEASGNGKDKVILIAAICGSVGGVLVIALIVCMVICKLKANKSYRVSGTSLNTKTASYYVNTSFKDEMFQTNSVTGSRVFDSNENKHFDAKHSFFDRE